MKKTTKIKLRNLLISTIIVLVILISCLVAKIIKFNVFILFMACYMALLIDLVLNDCSPKLNQYLEEERHQNSLEKVKKILTEEYVILKKFNFYEFDKDITILNSIFDYYNPLFFAKLDGDIILLKIVENDNFDNIIIETELSPEYFLKRFV